MISYVDLSIISVLLIAILIVIIVLLNNKIEQFIVADAQHIHNYDEVKQETAKLENKFEDQDVVKKKNITGDGYTVQLTYHTGPDKRAPREKKKYVTDLDFGYHPPPQYTACANASIAQKFKTGPKKLMPYDIKCGSPNKLTAENFYKTYKAHVVPIEDHYIRGYNYLDYTNSVNPYQIDFRILSQTTKGLPQSEIDKKNIPYGWNYAFHNTPAMRMP